MSWSYLNPPMSPSFTPSDSSELEVKRAQLRQIWKELGELEFQNPGLGNLPPLELSVASKASSDAPPTTAVIAESGHTLREVLRRICEVDFGFVVVEVADSAQQISEIVRKSRSQIVLWDADEISGFEEVDHFLAARRASEPASGMRFIWICKKFDERKVDAALRFRADAVIEKTTDSIASLKMAIQAVNEARPWFSPAFWDVYSRRKRVEAGSQITAYEEMVLGLFQARFGEREIAQKLAISQSTVTTFKLRLIHKLEQTPIADAERFAGWWIEQASVGPQAAIFNPAVD